MRTVITVFLLCLAALASLHTSSSAGVPPSYMHRHKARVQHTSQASITWQTDIHTAFRLARQQHKALFIDVYTSWCGYCAVMDQHVFPDAHIRALTRKFILLKINPEKSRLAQALSDQLGFHTYPSFAFVKFNGDLIGTATGYQSIPQLQELLQRALQRTQ